MCGLIGVIGNSVERDIINGLLLMQYRGYDSYGIATADDQKLFVHKSLTQIDANLPLNLPGSIGIGHTRWATHGSVKLENAHPLYRDHIAVAHNGIIENHMEVKELFHDFKMRGETDTECLLPLMLHANKSGIYFLQHLLKTLEGSYTILGLNSMTEEIYFMKKGVSPLLIGVKDNYQVIGSDITLFEDFDSIIEVGDMQCGVMSISGMTMSPGHTKQISGLTKKMQAIRSHKTWFQTEFAQQPEILLGALETPIEFPEIAPSTITLTGCGSANLVGQIGQHWFRRIGKIHANSCLASELPSGLECIAAISQSGETADTLRALRYSDAQFKVGVINKEQSSMQHYIDHLIPTLAGPEISVASTKATTAQMLSLFRWACHISNVDMGEDLKKMIEVIKSFMQESLHEIEEIAQICANQSSLFILGRDLLYPIACEGALKVKELAYLHAEGMHAAELKHGPLAVIDQSSIVICLSPGDDISASEILARGGQIIVLTEKPELFPNARTIRMPHIDPLLTPFLYIIPMQWLAYSLALLKDNNIDMPRNLAKSVTVL